jgi:hypothetical protein
MVYVYLLKPFSYARFARGIYISASRHLIMHFVDNASCVDIWSHESIFDTAGMQLNMEQPWRGHSRD